MACPEWAASVFAKLDKTKWDGNFCCKEDCRSNHGGDENLLRESEKCGDQLLQQRARMEADDEGIPRNAEANASVGACTRKGEVKNLSPTWGSFEVQHPGTGLALGLWVWVWFWVCLNFGFGFVYPISLSTHWFCLPFFYKKKKNVKE